MGTTVLVTGGYGFIGAYVVKESLKAGDRVIVIDRQQEGNAADEVLSAQERAAVEAVARTIPGPRTLRSILQKNDVETVVHLASPLGRATEDRPGAVVEEMIRPHLAILDACRFANIRRLVWASSVGVFGRSQDYPTLPIPNDAAQLPLTIYGAGKSFLEQLSSRYTLRYGLATLGLRFPLIYGPGRQRGGGQFTTQMIEAAALSRPCTVEFADEKRAWMYVTDAARAVLLALAAGPVASFALTLCSEVATTRQAGGLLTDLFPGAELEMLSGTTDLVADYDPRPAFDQIGFKPDVTLRDGLLATANAARERAGLPPVS